MERPNFQLRAFPLPSSPWLLPCPTEGSSWFRQGAGEKEPEDFAQDSRRFGARADILNNLSIKRKKTKHVRSSSKMSGRKIF